MSPDGRPSGPAPVLAGGALALCCALAAGGCGVRESGLIDAGPAPVAQGSTDAGTLIYLFGSDARLTPVWRDTDPADPRGVMELLWRGPNSEERERGLWSALVSRSVLHRVAVAESAEGELHVHASAASLPRSAEEAAPFSSTSQPGLPGGPAAQGSAAPPDLDGVLQVICTGLRVRGVESVVVSGADGRTGAPRAWLRTIATARSPWTGARPSSGGGRPSGRPPRSPAAGRSR